MNNPLPLRDSSAMTLPKTLLPLLAVALGLGGCVYEEYEDGYYEQPRQVYYGGGGYVQRDVVVPGRERKPRRPWRTKIPAIHLS